MITRFFRALSSKTEASFCYLAWGLVILNIVIFTATLFSPTIVEQFALKPFEVLERPWIVVTAMFLHADFEHLMQNMIALFIFGIILEKVIGSGKWIFIYLTAGIFGNFVGILAYPYAVSLGASGAITGIVGTLAVLRPKMMVYLGGPLPMILLAGIWVVVNMAGFFNPTDNVGYAVHLAGYAAGIVYGFLLRPWFKEEDAIRRKVDMQIPEEDFRRFEDEYIVEKKRKKK